MNEEKLNILVATVQQAYTHEYRAGESPQENQNRANKRVKSLIQSEIREELKKVYREIIKNNVAGNVKWYVDDRIKELQKGEEYKRPCSEVHTYSERDHGGH